MSIGTASYGPQGSIEKDAAQTRETLVLEHLPQVRIIASRIYDRLPDHIFLEDLISTGVLGLLAAIDNFDSSYQVQLRTYAEYRIHGAIIDSLRDMDHVPRDARKKSKKIEQAIQAVRNQLGREPLEEEIASELALSMSEYQRWLVDSQEVEIHRMESNSGDETQDLLSVISDDESSWPSQIVERAELQRLLSLALDRMPRQERLVLNLYYYEELTLREIGEVMEMHLSRIGQLRVQAILRLRSHLERVWPSSRGGRE